MIYPQMVTEHNYQVVDRTTTLCDGTAVSGGGTPDTGGGTPLRPVPAEFNHCLKYNSPIGSCSRTACSLHSVVVYKNEKCH